jgi:rubrerythrin
MDENVLKDKGSLLRSAIKGEEDGITFYGLLAQRATNPEARTRLEHLRDDEKRHKAILISLFHKHVGGDPGTLPAQGIGPLAKAFDNGKLRIFNSEMEYINLAIETELAASRFYIDGGKVAPDKEFAGIMHSLAEEENSHYEILKAEREALAGNYFWFSSDSGAHMED